MQVQKVLKVKQVQLVILIFLMYHLMVFYRGQIMLLKVN